MQPADQIHTAQERNHDSRRHDTYDHLLQPLHSFSPGFRQCLLQFFCHESVNVSLPISKISASIRQDFCNSIAYSTFWERDLCKMLFCNAGSRRRYCYLCGFLRYNFIPLFVFPVCLGSLPNFLHSSFRIMSHNEIMEKSSGRW